MKWTRFVLLFAAVLFLWNLWGYDLWAPDEQYFGEGAREMIVDGEWIVPHVNGVVTTDKPPLFFWLISLFSLPFGKVLSFTARLPSVLAGLGTLALVMRLGGRVSTHKTAVLSGFVLCTSYLFWQKSRWVQIDATLCLLIWIALTAFLAFRDEQANGRRAGWVFWSAMALAVLAKGPVGLLLPLGIALLTLAFDRDLARWRRFAPLSGPGLFIVIVGFWIVLTIFAGPEEYTVWGALQEHFVERGLYGMHHAQPPWYYLDAVPLNLLPWTGLLLGAYLLAWRRRDATDRFLMVATIFVVLFFTISTEKRELYVLPAFPAFALLIGRYAGCFLGFEPRPERSPSRRWLTVGQSVIGGILALVGLALPFLAKDTEPVAYWTVVAVALMLLLTGALTLLAVLRGWSSTTVIAPAAGFAAMYLFATTAVYPALNTVKSARPFAERIREVTAASREAGERVVTYDLGNLPESFAFYSDGVYTVETTDPAVVIEHLRRDAIVYAVINDEIIELLPTELRNRMRIVDRTRLSRRDLSLVANR